MKYPMFNRKSLFFLAVAISFVGATVFIMSGLGSNGIARAEGFTNESIEGTYSGTRIAEATDDGGIVIVNFDGNGNLSGSDIINRPAPFGKRQVLDTNLT